MANSITNLSLSSRALLSTHSIPKPHASSLFHSSSRTCKLHFLHPLCPPLIRSQPMQLRRPSAIVSSSSSSSSSSSVTIQEQVKPMHGEEQMEDLIGAIRDELASMGEEVGAAEALREKLQLVDLIERLGIPRFFEPQIRRILNSTFMQWDEKNGLGDAENTVLAFRLLRLHGFPVSAGVIEKIKDENVEFSSFSVESPEKVSGMLNLYKCSQTGFPSESKIMDEARDFSVSQLRIALLEGNPSLLQPNNLRREIKFALEYPRRFNLWRLESRSIIKQLWPSSGIKSKCLKLAKLDLEMLQKLHKQETDVLEIWWEDQGVQKLEYARALILLKCFFAISVTIFEPQFAAFRAAFAKTSCLGTLVDDLFDLPSNFECDGLARFIDAYQRWDASLLDDLPDHKLVLTSLQSTVMEQATESSKAQGRDLFPFFKALWADDLVAFAKEAEWLNSGRVPSWIEYMEAARRSVSGITCIWTSVFLMGEPITEEVLKHIGKDSRFVYLVTLVGRLSNDLATYERETREGKLATSLNCYMREHPDCSKEDAVAAVQHMIESACHELELELFKSRGKVPECCSRAAITFARAMAFVYKRADAFSIVCDDEYEDLVEDYMRGSFA